MERKKKPMNRRSSVVREPSRIFHAFPTLFLRVILNEIDKVSRRGWRNVRVEDDDNFPQSSSVPNGDIKVCPKQMKGIR